MVDESRVRSEPVAIGAIDSTDNIARPRLDVVDQIRGLVMVLMVLDHVRDYFQLGGIDPNDPAKAGVGLFLTRWVTHFCAPVFVALAGASIFLARSRGVSRRDQAVFLLTRGLWLLLLEVTLVKLEITFNLSYRMVLLQVIWAIGLSMIAMSALIYLPVPMVGRSASPSWPATTCSARTSWGLSAVGAPYSGHGQSRGRGSGCSWPTRRSPGWGSWPADMASGPRCSSCHGGGGPSWSGRERP